MKIIKFLMLSLYILLPFSCFTHNIAYTEQVSSSCQLCNTAQAILYEDALAFVIKNQTSTLKTSLFIVPKKHIARFDEMDLDARQDQHLLIHLMSVAQLLASRLNGAQSFRITLSTGNELQNAPHICLTFESNESLQKA